MPPVENLWKFTEQGATAVLFSGGKDIRGPQTSGFVCGKRNFIVQLYDIGFPEYGPGRIMKVGREEMVGLYSAVKQYVNADHKERLAWCESEIDKLILWSKTSSLFNAERSFPNEAGQPIPRAEINIVNNSIESSLVIQMLLEEEPGIIVGEKNNNGFYINPMTLDKGDLEIIIEKLSDIEKKLL